MGNFKLLGVMVESGRTHYSITNKKGEYSIEGLTSGIREVTVLDKGKDSVRLSQEVHLVSDIEGLDFMISTKAQH